MSDTIVVMSQGHVEQVGGPEDVYVNPASAFVARFLGNANLVEARIGETRGDEVAVSVDGFGVVPVPVARSRGMSQGASALMVVRAERLYLDGEDGELPPDAIGLPAEVSAVDYQGQAARYFVEIGGRSLQAVNPIEHRPYRQGARVRAVIRGRDCALVPAEPPR